MKAIVVTDQAAGPTSMPQTGSRTVSAMMAISLLVGFVRIMDWRAGIPRLSSSGETEALEEHGVGGDKEAGTRHRESRPFGSEHPPKCWGQQTGGDRKGQAVVADGPAEVLAHLA